jgi:hypothetical protein
MDRSSALQALSGTPADSLIDPGAHEQGAGIIATVANATRPFLYLPPSDGRPPWSALEWAEHPEGWLFMTIRDDSSSATLPLANLWLDLIVGRLLNSASLRRSFKTQAEARDGSLRFHRRLVRRRQRHADKALLARLARK